MATPRTGSNLLHLSLSTHSNARWAGEAFNPKFGAPDTEHYNLFKVFPHPEVESFLGLPNTLRVYLWRQDTEAQLRSWKKACKTGKWLADQEGLLEPAAFSYKDALNQIRWADSNFLKAAHYTVSYERLVSHWNDTLRNILILASWPYEFINQAIKKQSTIN